jgi:hypothetical protein
MQTGIAHQNPLPFRVVNDFQAVTLIPPNTTSRFFLAASLSLVALLGACSSTPPITAPTQPPVLPTATLRGSLDDSARCIASQIELQLRVKPLVNVHAAERSATILAGEEMGQFLADLREKEGLIVAQFIGRGGPYNERQALRLVRPCV